MIEGEGLLNDATALVVYRFAVVAVASGAFSLSHATWKFARSRWWAASPSASRSVRDPAGEAAARPLADGDRDRAPVRVLAHPPGGGARRLGRAGGGNGRPVHGLVHARADERGTRLQGEAVWEIVTFVLNAVLFSLVGLQLRPIVQGIAGHSVGQLAATRRRCAAWSS